MVKNTDLGLAPALLGALLNEIAIPELVRWLTGLHADGKVVTEAEALAKLNMDAATGDAKGRAFLETHPA